MLVFRYRYKKNSSRISAIVTPVTRNCCVNNKNVLSKEDKIVIKLFRQGKGYWVKFINEFPFSKHKLVFVGFE